MKAHQVVAFSSGTAGDGFALEQKPWPKKSAEGFADWLKEQNISPTGGNIFAAYEQFISQCNGDGDLVATLRVRLHDLNTPYTLRATYGQLGQAKLVEETRQEYLAFELDQTKEIDFGELVACAWNGDLWAAGGKKVNQPPLPVLAGRKATMPYAVYGVLEATVRETRYEYELTISPRTPTPAQLDSKDSIHDQLYAASAMLFCNERIVIKEIEMPDDFGNCQGGRGGTKITNPDDKEQPEDSGLYDVTFEAFNYCTGAAVTGATVRLIYKDGEGKDKTTMAIVGTPIRLPSGSYAIRVTATGYTPSNEDDLTENDSFTLSAPAKAST